MLDNVLYAQPKRLPKLATGWKYVKLGSLIDPLRPITYGVVQPGPHDSDGVPLIRGGDYSDRWRPVAELRRVSRAIDEQFSRARLKSGDLVITIKGDVGACAQVPPWLDGANLSQTNARLSIDRTKANPRYIMYYLRSNLGRREVYEHTKTGAQPGLIFGDILQFFVPLPEHIEVQNQIVTIIDAWDEAIHKLDALLTAKEKQYSTLLNQLIFGSLRGANTLGDKAHVRLGEVTRELTARNRHGRLGRERVMGVTNSRGLVPMREQTIGGDLTRYKILPPRAFAYNPMRINVGSISMLREDFEVLVSPDYVLFECLPTRLDADFLDHLRQSHFWSHYINAGSSGSVRMRTYYDDLAAIRIKLPPLKKQQEISYVLNTVKHEIRLIKLQAKATSRQERGLMEKLLTGEWRVKVDAEAAA
jgi:type I restriction enzyme, S subunit